MNGPANTPEILQSTIMNRLSSAAIQNGLAVEPASPGRMLSNIVIALTKQLKEKVLDQPTTTVCN
jgi:hypothetical protein